MERHKISESQAKDVMIKTDKNVPVTITIIPVSAGAIPRATISA